MEDGEPPAVTVPGNLTVNAEPGLATAVLTYAAPTATDNMAVTSGPLLTAGLASGATFPAGVTAISYAAEDAAGNISTANFTVTVVDGEDPVITVPGNIIVPAETGTALAVVTYVAPTATDNLGVTSGPVLTAGLASGAAFPAGLTTVTYEASDAAGNTGVGSFSVTVTPDTSAPIISIAALIGPANGDLTTEITLSKPSTNFEASDLTLTNATAILTGTGTSYTAVVTPLADGPVSISVAPGVFTDGVGNLNTASNTVTATHDATAPTISIAPLTGPANGNLTAVVTLSEASTSFTQADLSLVNATANLSGSGTSYVAVLTPLADGAVSLSVAAGTFTDAAGNGNTASNEVTSTHDATAPTISIADFTGPLNGDLTAMITLSEASTSFTQADLSLVNATANLSGSGTSYVAVLTPLADGAVSLSVAAGTFIDAAGNLNTASNEVTSTHDATAPTLSIASFTGAMKGDLTAAITLSEAATDFDGSDLSLVNATATLTGSGTRYTAVLTPVADGLVSLSVAASTFTDAAGNLNRASNEVTSTHDATSPSVSLTTTQASTAGAATFDVTITFSEIVTGLVIDDFELANGSASGLTGSGLDYSMTVLASGAGIATVVLPAAAAQDSAGNGNLQSNTLSVASATVQETQEQIATFMQTRARQLLASQPDLSGLLSGSRGRSFSTIATQGSGNFSYASGTEKSVWMLLNGSWSKVDGEKTAYVFGALGSHVTFTPNLLVGGMLEFDHSESGQDGAELRGTGWLAGPYFVARLPQAPVYFEGRALFGQSSNKITPFGTYTDTFDTQRALAQVKVSGELQSGALTLLPNLGYAYTEDRQKRYVDGLGNDVPSQTLSMSEASLGLDLSYGVGWVRANNALTLSGGIKLIRSNTSGEGYAIEVMPEDSALRGRINLGIDYSIRQNTRWRVTLDYDGLGLSDYEAVGVEIGFQRAF
ncbi:Ig-like domain-containing protein [Puniceibacterium antarcticum]|uniref:Ig-like domain-containing protein n=1 Tax=Puniceibacterium antarcticum TaxID=1206336 RepID=UPI003CCC43F0